MYKLIITIFCLLLLTGCQQPLGASKPAVYKFSDFSKVIKADPKDKIEVESKNGKFKMTRWDEVSMEVGLIDDKKTSKDVELVEMLGAENSDGGYELNVILKEKPQSNVIKYSINSDGLDFFYQPIYTEQEILDKQKEGDFINRDAMGSYTIYSSTQKKNYEGGKKYGIGKVGNIHRPKVIDNKGNWVWGEFNQDAQTTGVLLITIPQKFLDDAVYPVIVDPTFGYETQGTAGYASWQGSAPATNATAGMVDQYTASNGDAITGFSAYGYADTGSSPLSIAAYTVVAGNPTSRLSTKVSITMVFSTPGWYSVGSLSQAMAAGSVYCSAWSSEDQSNTKYIAYDNGTAPGRFNSTNTTLETTFGVTGTDSGRHYSVYATYTAGGGGTTATNSYYNISDE